MNVGAAHLCITPPLGTRMAGYRARTTGATRVYDDLFVRCLAFDDDGRRSALLSLDVMGVDVGWVAEFREHAVSSTGVAPDGVLVATTHTHAAQGGLFRPSGTLGSVFNVLMGDGAARYDPTSYDWLLRQAGSAIRLAFERLAPATLAIAQGNVDGIAGNRVWFDRPADSRCLVVAALDPSGEPLGQIIHFNCHPTVLGETDLGISGDFPGVACRLLERATGSPTLFLNGALGDVSTRSTRREQSYREVVRFGRILGGRALGLLGELAPSTSQRVGTALETIALEPRSEAWLSRIEERIVALESSGATAHEQARQLLTAREGAQSARRAASALAELESVPIDLQRFDLGDVTFVAVPGEVFSDAQTALDAAYPGERVRIVAPGNGYLGYFPSAEAYDHGGYEVGVSLVERGSAERITERAIKLVGAGGPSTVGRRQ